MKFYARIAISMLAAMLVWLVSGTARAAAPQCDPRGAITFAPNPILDEPNASIDVGVDDCNGKRDERAYNHAPVPFAASGDVTTHGVALPVGLSILPATPVASAHKHAVALLVSAGVSLRVERPPR